MTCNPRSPVGEDGPLRPTEDQSLLLQEGPREDERPVQCHKGSLAGGKPRRGSLDISFPFLHASLIIFLCLLGTVVTGTILILKLNKPRTRPILSLLLSRAPLLRALPADRPPCLASPTSSPLCPSSKRNTNPSVPASTLPSYNFITGFLFFGSKRASFNVLQTSLPSRPDCVSHCSSLPWESLPPPCRGPTSPHSFHRPSSLLLQSFVRARPLPASLLPGCLPRRTPTCPIGPSDLCVGSVSFRKPPVVPTNLLRLRQGPPPGPMRAGPRSSIFPATSVGTSVVPGSLNLAC